MPFVAEQGLVAWCGKVLQRAGLAGELARQLAEVLCAADAQGVHSHGIVRLEEYVPALQSGAWRPTADWTTVRETPTTAVLDGGSGVGPLLARRAMELCIAKAEGAGVAVVTLRNGGHFGRAGYYAEMAARQGLIGLAMTNASPCIAPWGGRERVLGNNPLAIAVPRADHPPIVLDMALSVVAQGRIRLARDRGEALPEGWGLDPEGRPTREPAQVLKGSLLPVGGYKGYGLALMVDLLTGVLAGGAFGREVTSARDLRTQNISHTFIAVRVAHFREPQAFLGDVERLVQMVRSSALAPGHREILLPGEPEQRYAGRRPGYVELPDDICRRVQQVAARLGLTDPLPCEGDGGPGPR